MATVTDPECPACARLARVRDDDPFLVARLDECVVLLHKHQSYEGWCAVWLREHVERLELLPIARQLRVWEDVARIAAAITHEFQPRRLNYECLGNVVAHAHWHVIPRYERPRDPEPGATVWVRPVSELECGVDDARRDALVARLRRAITRP